MTRLGEEGGLLGLSVNTQSSILLPEQLWGCHGVPGGQTDQLTKPLSSHNYQSKLHTLLHTMDRHSMTRQSLTRGGPFLSFAVPGLLEGKPSLVQGDSCHSLHPWTV
eukprot:GFUD01107914.1.p1 GENE.GFUD01107914.1~~GFUD01107914.1.p1  ORF type:complete len:107 (-),score=15.14 GFUD01107914.1:1092-1412(-)